MPDRQKKMMFCEGKGLGKANFCTRNQHHRAVAVGVGKADLLEFPRAVVLVEGVPKLAQRERDSRGDCSESDLVWLPNVNDENLLHRMSAMTCTTRNKV